MDDQQFLLGSGVRNKSSKKLENGHETMNQCTTNPLRTFWQRSNRMKWSASAVKTNPNPRSLLPILCGQTILCEKRTSPPSKRFAASHVHRQVDHRRLTERCAAKPTRERERLRRRRTNECGRRSRAQRLFIRTQRVRREERAKEILISQSAACDSHQSGSP